MVEMLLNKSAVELAEMIIEYVNMYGKKVAMFDKMRDKEDMIVEILRLELI